MWRPARACSGRGWVPGEPRELGVVPGPLFLILSLSVLSGHLFTGVQGWGPGLGPRWKEGKGSLGLVHASQPHPPTQADLCLSVYPLLNKGPQRNGKFPRNPMLREDKVPARRETCLLERDFTGFLGMRLKTRHQQVCGGWDHTSARTTPRPGLLSCGNPWLLFKL